MVRLVITDFPSKEDNESFYTGDNFDDVKDFFCFDEYKKRSVTLPKSETINDLYSLNLLSKKYIPSNTFLVYITNTEFYILFNHETIYSAKMNENFITDDMVKSVLISKHLTMLSSSGEIEKIYYLINSEYRYAIENILKQNIKNEKNEIIAKDLGNVSTLVKKLPELETINSYTKKVSVLISFILFIFWVQTYGFDFIEKNYLINNHIQKYQNDLKVENRFFDKAKKELEKQQKEYDDLVSCITNKKD